jgi:ditrans,polycis-polyprenyl diphosphate synthase
MEWLEAAIRPVACAILKHGAVPRHVAFIMDGNRRYAEQNAITVAQGHKRGFERLLRSLEWCLDLGITAVSVYAFSVDNYRRNDEEVAALMDLAETKMEELAGPDSDLAARGVRICVTGDLTLAPPSLRIAAQRVMDATQHHSRAILNICFSYT